MSLPRCANCQRRDSLEAGFDTFRCLSCGADTDYNGNLLPRDPQFLQESHQEQQARLEAER
jgi:hypothetical protein